MNCMVWNPLMWVIESQKKSDWMMWYSCILLSQLMTAVVVLMTLYCLEMITRVVHCQSRFIWFDGGKVSWVVWQPGPLKMMNLVSSGFDWIFWLYATRACKFWMRLVFPWLHDVAWHSCYSDVFCSREISTMQTSKIMIPAVWQAWFDMVGNGVFKLCNWVTEWMTHDGIPVLCVLHLM